MPTSLDAQEALMRHRTFTFPLAAAVLLLADCSTDQATAPNTGSVPALTASAGGIAPPQSSPHGKSYSAWAAEWWKWVLETPASINPLVDPTGENCAVNQADHVWFLAGALGGEPVTRECTIPSGRALLIPLINLAYFAFLSDPPEQRSEEFIRAQVACIADADFPLVEIDGIPVGEPERYLEKSIVFEVVLPEDNLFGATEEDIPELTLSPSVDEGFYLFLTPRTPGAHTIRWQARSASCGFSEDITYHLTVTPGKS
jgi:hypothetical protein